jgi:hypothetical protein
MIMRRLTLIALLAIWPAFASAQVAFIAPTPPTADNGDRIATTAWVNNFVNGGMPLANGKIWIGSAGGVAVAQTPSGDGTITNAGVLTVTKTNNVAFGPFATQATPCTIAQGCTGQTGQTAAFNALAPTPTRAGDITYWNGSNYVNLAGNNSGTQILSENASGVPAWSPGGAGSVTSVTCGTGLSGGTFTTSGTCAVNLSVLTASLGANVALNNTANYFDGPSVAQGTSRNMVGVRNGKPER